MPTFKFTDRWQSSLRKVVPKDLDAEAGLLELRDQQLEDWLGGHLGYGTYTPTLTNMVVGTGGGATNTARWATAGSLIHIEGLILFGTAGATLPGAGVEEISLPPGFTFLSTPLTPTGWCRFSAAGAATMGNMRIESATTFRPLSLATAAVSAQAVDITAAVPGVWVAGDSIFYSLDALVAYQ